MTIRRLPIATQSAILGGWRGLWIAAAAAAFPAGALAVPRENVTFTSVPSQGGANDGLLANTVLHRTFTGGYQVRSIHVTATILINTTGTEQADARILVTPPVGKPFILMPSRVTASESNATTDPSTGDVKQTSYTYTDYVFPLNTPIDLTSVVNGDWSFRFFQENQRSTTHKDATWSSIQFTLDDDFVLPSTAQLLTHDAMGAYAEMEPNDDAYLTPNVISAMQPGESISGTISGSTVVVDPSHPSMTPDATVDTFVIRTALAPTNPPTIYRYQLSLDSLDSDDSTDATSVKMTGGILARPQNTYVYPATYPLISSPAIGQNYMLIGGALPSFNYSYGALEESQRAQNGYGLSNYYGDWHHRVNQWDGFGRGEAIAYRVSYAGPALHPYKVTLSRSTVTPIDVGAPLPIGLVTVNATFTDSSLVTGYAWRCVLFDSTLHEIPDANSENNCFATSSTPMTRSLAAGTYYLAVANAPVSALTGLTAPSTTQPMPGNPQGYYPNCNSVIDPLPFFADSVICEPGTNQSYPSMGSVVPLSVVVTLTDNADVEHTIYCPNPGATDPCIKQNPQDVLWYKFTVADPVSSVMCCRGTTCLSVNPQVDPCTNTIAGSHSTIVSACGPNNQITTCCYADFDHSGVSDVNDIFIYLNAWFGNSAYATVGGNGTALPQVNDIFLFLNAWFAGCS